MLVEFILLTHPHEWPVSMKSEYWECEIVAVQELLEDVNTDLVSRNITKRLTNISESLIIFVKGSVAHT